jgi:hypothetical protein
MSDLNGSLITSIHGMISILVRRRVVITDIQAACLLLTWACTANLGKPFNCDFLGDRRQSRRGQLVVGVICARTQVNGMSR